MSSCQPSLHRAADLINRPHEDYPLRIAATKDAITETVDAIRLDLRITSDLLAEIHRIVFPDHGTMAGKWRNSNVRVGSHLAPRWEWLDSLMHELGLLYLDLPISQENLLHWYFDFETVHPFVDGNDRIGGIIVVATHLQHGINPAPGQQHPPKPAGQRAGNAPQRLRERQNGPPGQKDDSHTPTKHTPTPLEAGKGLKPSVWERSALETAGPPPQVAR